MKSCGAAQNQAGRPWPNRLALIHLRASTEYCIPGSRSIIHSRSSTLVNRDAYCGRCSGGVALRIRHLERDGVHTPIEVSVSLDAELHRLTVRSNHNIVQSRSVGASETVFWFITAHADNNHIADIHIGIAGGSGTSDEVGHVERVVIVVRWPHVYVAVAQCDYRRATHSQGRAL